MASHGIKERIDGLETIRFVCALWVAISHIGLPPLSTVIAGSSLVGWFVSGVYKALISGPAAVIAFFVISGVCIHFPNRGGGSPNWLNFYTRRYLRVGIPLVAAVLLGAAIGLRFGDFERTILWSLFAELIYYTLYPLLLFGKGKLGWHRLIGLATLLAALVIVSDPSAGNYSAFGNHLNWLLGLPAWLLGCLAAERARVVRLAPRHSIWIWRTGIWLASSICLVLRFKTAIGYPISLTLFAFIVYFWILREIDHFSLNKESRVLKWAGTWSYSLYLMHFPCFLIIHRLLAPFASPAPWPLLMIGTLGLTYGFYLLVERPAHRLARWLAKAIARPPKPESASRQGGLSVPATPDADPA